MDIKKIFRGIGAKLEYEFNISSEINHNGNKGTYRENALKDFLKKGKLPRRYGVGSGEIIGRAENVSKQCDLIIYDQLDGISLVYDEDIQVYPIESVFGVIEVKSSLSKEELIKSLENIKSTKKLAPNEYVTEESNSPLSISYARPKPFGIVFAYSLAGNSLESLVKNLKEWEEKNESNHYTNLVVVLNEGIIYHYANEIKHVYTNDGMSNINGISYLAYKKDTLFHFYSILLELCTKMKLGSVNLESYFDPAEQMGEYMVRNHNRMINSKDDTVSKFTYSFIQNIVKNSKKITQYDLYIKMLGQIPEGMNQEALDSNTYLYNPENLEGIHINKNIEDFITRTDKGVFMNEKSLIPITHVEVDNEIYHIPEVYISDKNLEIIKNKKIDDIL